MAALARFLTFWAVMKASFTGTRAFKYGITGAEAGLLYAVFAFVVEERFGSDYEVMHIEGQKLHG